MKNLPLGGRVTFCAGKFFGKIKLTAVNIFDLQGRNDYTIYWFARGNLKGEFLFNP